MPAARVASFQGRQYSVSHDFIFPTPFAVGWMRDRKR
jgi:hypothetical protein